MFHWICPECGREIPPAVRECSTCDPHAAPVPATVPAAAATPEASSATIMAVAESAPPAPPAAPAPVQVDPLLGLARKLREVQEAQREVQTAQRQALREPREAPRESHSAPAEVPGVRPEPEPALRAPLLEVASAEIAPSEIATDAVPEPRSNPALLLTSPLLLAAPPQAIALLAPVEAPVQLQMELPELAELSPSDLGLSDLAEAVATAEPEAIAEPEALAEPEAFVEAEPVEASVDPAPVEPASPQLTAVELPPVEEAPVELAVSEPLAPEPVAGEPVVAESVTTELVASEPAISEPAPAEPEPPDPSHAGRVPTPEPTLTPVALAIKPLDPLNALPVPVEAPPPVERGSALASPALGLAPLQDSTAIANRIRPASSAAQIMRTVDAGPKITLPGPALPKALKSLEDAGLSKILVDRPGPEKSNGRAWVTGGLAAVAMLGALLGMDLYNAPRSAASASPAPVAHQTETPAPDPAPVPAARVSSAQPPSAQPAPAPTASYSLAKAVEVTGLRFADDKTPEVRYLVVNHSGAPLSAVTVYVTIRNSTSKLPLSHFSFRAPALGPYESKEMVSELDKTVRPGDWQSLHADVELSQ